MFNYISIKKETTHEIEIKKSRFICYLIQIKSEEEFNHHLNRIRKEHYKATHHCFAYILGQDADIQRMSDDGEPSGTAGLPMLEVLRQEEVTYVMTVVVRYFGGTKLGSGGLIRAYSQAVSQTLGQAQKIKNIDHSIQLLKINYAQLDPFNHHIQHMPVKPTVLSIEYTENVQIEVAIPSDQLESFNKELTNLFNGQIQIESLGSRAVDLDYTD